MNDYKTRHIKGAAKTSCIGILIVVLISAVIGGFAIPYSVNHWLEWAGKPQAFQFWHGFLIGLIPHIGFGSVIVALATFVLTFFF